MNRFLRGLFIDSFEFQYRTNEFLVFAPSLHDILNQFNESPTVCRSHWLRAWQQRDSYPRRLSTFGIIAGRPVSTQVQSIHENSYELSSLRMTSSTPNPYWNSVGNIHNSYKLN